MDRGEHTSDIDEIRRDQAALRVEFGALYGEVLQILYRHDPADVADLEDEYDPEVRAILRRLRGVSSPGALRKVIHEEFTRFFGHHRAGTEADYDKVAAEVWTAWQRHTIGPSP